MSIERHDCVVVGCGPAGLSAALWLDRLGIDFVALDGAGRLGGELHRVNLPVVDFLGLAATDGRGFLGAVERQLATRDLPLRFNVPVDRVDLQRHTVSSGDARWEARSLILALGLSRRTLEVPGAADRIGRGLSYSATSDLARLEGHPVAVIGGGDGALENALLLAERCPRVFLIHRREAFRARPHFVERVRSHPRIEILGDTEVTRLEGDAEALTEVRVEGPSGARGLSIRWLVVKIGFVPNTAFLRGSDLHLDRHGYVLTDRWMHTSVPGVFAAGDLCNSRSPCIASAVGDGAVAAREVERWLREQSDPR